MVNSTEPSLIRIARADSQLPSEAPLALGARVRELRIARQWTLAQTAKNVGLARSTLSKIENDLMSPTFDALRKLADGLEVSIPQLFTRRNPSRDKCRMSITRTDQGAPHLTSTYEHQLLANDLPGKQMLPYRSTIRARTLTEFGNWVRHGGEEFLIVLSGDIRIFFECYEPVVLHTGDSTYYDASMGHNIVSISPDDAVILWVTALT